MLAYTVASARQSEVFDVVLVSTDAPSIAEIARHYGASVPFLRPTELAGDLSPDIGWVQHAIAELRARGIDPEVYSILRPTSPLRSPETIRRAWAEFREDEGADSLRAVERCGEHPAKMWIVEDDRMRPLLDDGGADPPWHSTPYQGLPVVHVQNASLEMARVRTLDATRTIAGRVVRPFVTQGREGFDVNRPEDWFLLERLLDNGDAALPEIDEEPYVP